jgi:hypothetical protein
MGKGFHLPHSLFKGAEGAGHAKAYSYAVK